MGKLLKRCTVCKLYGGKHLVLDPKTGRKACYCHRCWMALYGKKKDEPEPPSASPE